ncbi:hypothetical protein EVAR_25213_1 [Eumeta japonica]|uniref:Uncharacterized protein n=1 Tax=Eumeta variegata TaxID=151549 RepID=A0A4C1WGF9_EUMVA|nr:hypothetical protein EVAR_25213_1 [Eumeta japonica]
MSQSVVGARAAIPPAVQAIDFANSQVPPPVGFIRLDTGMSQLILILALQSFFDSSPVLNPDPGLAFDFDPGPTIVFDPSPVLNPGSGLAFDSDPGPVSHSALRLAFNNSSNFNEAGGYYENKI